MIRFYALAATIGCTIADAAKCLRSLAGNGRPDDLCAPDATAERPSPADLFRECCDGMDADWAQEPTPLADAAMAFLRRSLAELDAVETYDDFLYATGGDL